MCYETWQEWGMPPIVRRTSGILKQCLDQLRLPSPSYKLNFRRCLYLGTSFLFVNSSYNKSKAITLKLVYRIARESNCYANCIMEKQIKLLRFDIGGDVMPLGAFEQTSDQYTKWDSKYECQNSGNNETHKRKDSNP